LRERGFEGELQKFTRKGGLIVGICGGFQMLGKEIFDPEGMERGGAQLALGLLPVKTIMAHEKVTVPARGMLIDNSLFGQSLDSCEVSGYEIHLGTTEYLDGAEPFAAITRQGDEDQNHLDGCVSQDRRVFGTYLHGLFDHDPFRHAFLRASRASLQMPAPFELVAWSERRRQQLDLLADAFGSALDLDAIFAMIGLPSPSVQVERRLS
jgi:adenosylcobyric acid synthase